MATIEFDHTQPRDARLADEVWRQVVQYVQLAMLTGTDVADYLRLIKVRLDASTGEHVLGDGQVELFDRQIKELLDKVDGLRQTDVETK